MMGTIQRNVSNMPQPEERTPYDIVQKQNKKYRNLIRENVHSSLSLKHFEIRKGLDITVKCDIL